MKTFIIDLDGMSSELSRELMGFVLTIGLNFRKIDQCLSSKTGRTLLVELETRAEEKALRQFLDNNFIGQPITIGNDNKANLNGKKVGVFTQVSNTDGLSNFYLDKSTGKKFTLVK